ncbi:Geranylgeranyl diphosphate synthase [Minicystis rosea]|nr:Geranylgeranyl diphosphate synthase [Minicystis rosea]
MAKPSALATQFPALLAEVRAAVDERLATLWDAEIGSLRQYGADVVAAADAARDLTMRGGKRYRAALLVAAYAGIAPEASLEPAYQGGIALELLQSYLLMQDDWMDGDLTRRGGPAVHATLATRMRDAHRGASFMILASDYTWGLAVRTLSDVALPAPRVLAAVQTFARLHADVVVGQQLDMLGNAPDVDVVHDLKTGAYTVRGPLVLGATLAGADATTLDALSRFAKPVGVAFQLRDDLLGTFGTPDQTGKPVGNDLRAGKRTAILAEAEKRLSPEGRAALDRAFGRAEATEAEVLAATAALESCGARAAVASRLARLCADAEAQAAALPVTDHARVLLAGAASALSPGIASGTMQEPAAQRAHA